jgi:hypothetical protein
MLTNTFIHIQGIGAITEKRLGVSVLRDWASLLAKKGFLQIIDSKMLPIIGFLFLLDNNFIYQKFTNSLSTVKEVIFAKLKI